MRLHDIRPREVALGRSPILRPKKPVTSPPPANYLEPFFVGLFEGDGAIAFGKTKDDNWSYPRLKINLKLNSENEAMLELIRFHIGGLTHRQRKKKGNDILWTPRGQKHCSHVLKIFDKYPLLTSSKICQYDYLKQCMSNRAWSYHLETRDRRYDKQQQMVEYYKQNFIIPHYFGPWLSGFIESSGSFRSTNGFSVDLGLYNDWYILNAIKTYFHSHQKLGIRGRRRFWSLRVHQDHGGTRFAWGLKGRFKQPPISAVGLSKKHPGPQYRLSMSGKPTIDHIIKHFEKNPLLGYKKVSYDLFCERYRLS
uniref:Homing endonuclease LAGLIDADG domain-containing protein n=1 Tax=Caulerpa ashmeadii TaxID=177078 RepID=A0A6B9VYT2_9CHLO|nr:hypothetical protein [Caulerpa ashmeadii]QHQ73216.1 hypothetical protein [Caulerpa ashmeadii]